MKKTVSFLLILAVLLSAMALISLSAGAEPAEASAPVFYGVQFTKPTENRQSIRFVSVVPNTSGSMLGYRITAEYTQNGAFHLVVYSADEGDATMESNRIYTKILEGDYQKELTASELGDRVGVANAAGLFAICLNNVPTDIGEIVFTVSAYVKSGSEIIAESGNSSFIVEDGTLSGKQVVYRENFDSVPTQASTEDTLQALGWQHLFARGWYGNSGSKSTAAVTDGSVSLDGGWDMFQMIPDEALKHYCAYSISMDVTIERLGVLDLIFNGTADAQDYLDAKTLTGSGDLIMFRDWTGEKDGSTTDCGTNDMQIKYCTYTGATPNVVKVVRDRSDLLSYGKSFRLTVNNDRGVLSVLVNGTEMISANISRNAGNSLALITQCAPVRLDNLIISGVPLAEEGTVLYSEDFEHEFTPYVNAFGTFGQKVNAGESGNHYLALSDAWAAGEMVSERVLYGLEQYTFEADITVNDGSFLNFFFNDTASLEGIQQKKSYSVANSKFALISLRAKCIDPAKKSFSDDQSLVVHVYNYDVDQAGTANSYFLQDTDGKYYGYNIGADMNMTRGTVYHFAFEIDNRGDSSTIRIYVDGSLVAEVSGYNKNNASGFYCWTQKGSGAYIDNIRVTVGAYNPESFSN